MTSINGRWVVNYPRCPIFPLIMSNVFIFLYLYRQCFQICTEMASFKPTKIQVYPKLGEKVTQDTLYWKNYKVSLRYCCFEKFRGENVQREVESSSDLFLHRNLASLFSPPTGSGPDKRIWSDHKHRCLPRGAAQLCCDSVHKSMLVFLV